MILDLVQNSIEAGAALVEVELASHGSQRQVRSRDNGHGMTDEQRAAALDPFYSDGRKHPGRRVGLGLPFLAQTCDQLGGSWTLDSRFGEGTELSFSLDAGHIDAPPIGELSALFEQVLCFAADYEAVIARGWDGGGYSLRRSELCQALGELDSVASRRLLREYIDSQRIDEPPFSFSGFDRKENRAI